MTRRALVLLIAVLCAAGCAGEPENATAPPGLDPEPGGALTEDWARLAPRLAAPLRDRDASSCHRGEPVCLDIVVTEMEARLAARPCAHTSPFAFTYLEMTRGVAEAFDEFDDAATISVIDARFAKQYFDAFDNWFAGRSDDVPAAWQVAFATAEQEGASAAVDLILGMNAHISRDLAYIVADLVRGRSDNEEPEDYRFVNEVIGDVKTPMLMAAAERFDPNLFLLDTELTTDGAPDPVELIGQWRSIAFEMGQRLAAADTAAELDAVIAEIERTAAGGAAVLVAASSADGITELAGNVAGGEFMGASFLGTAERLAYCQRDR